MTTEATTDDARRPFPGGQTRGACAAVEQVIPGRAQGCRHDRRATGRRTRPSTSSLGGRNTRYRNSSSAHNLLSTRVSRRFPSRPSRASAGGRTKLPHCTPLCATMKVFAFLAAAFATVHVARATPGSQRDQVSETKNDPRGLTPLDSLQASIAVGAGFSATGRGIEVSESTSETIQTIAGTGLLASQFLPPPYNVVAGSGFATLGAFIGAPEGVSNGDILKYVSDAFEIIGLQLTNIQDGINKIIDSLDVVQATVSYTSSVVTDIRVAQLMEPYQKIDAAYNSLMTTYFPTSEGDNWKQFFDTAEDSCSIYESEVFNALEPDRVRAAVEFYEQGTNPNQSAKVNNMGMCGSAFLFQYIMTVRQELLMMCTYGSHVKKEGTDGKDKKDWILNEGKSKKYAIQYKKDLEDYDEQILNAVSRGGLGLAEFVKMTAGDLLEGVGDEGEELGFCYRCDETSEEPCKGKAYKPYDWPTSSNRIQGDPNYAPNKEELNDLQKCNAHEFKEDWPYFDTQCIGKKDFGKQRKWCCRDKDDSPVNSGELCRYKCVNEKTCPSVRPRLTWRSASQVRKDKDTTFVDGGIKARMGCCSCACLTEDDHNDSFGGKTADHKKYDRHCERKEKVYDPWENAVASSKQLSENDLKSYNSLPLSKNFRISCIDNYQPEGSSSLSSTLAITSQRKEFREEGGSWWRATPDSYVTAITFKNDGSFKKDVLKNYVSDLTDIGTSNNWFAQGETDQPGSCENGVEFGKYQVKIGNWRIRAWTREGRLTVTHKNGKVSKIYRCNGTTDSDQSQYGGITEDLGRQKCAYVTPRYLQLGGWRIGRWNNKDRHISVSHRNGQTAEMYREDGRTFSENGENTGGNLWSSSEVISARYEAEDQQMDSKSVIKNSNSGFTGAAYVDMGGRGSYVEFTNVDGGAGGTCTLVFRYANKNSDDRPLSVAINGDVVGTLAFPSTGSWSNWQTDTIVAKCPAGNIELLLTATDKNGPNLDGLDYDLVGAATGGREGDDDILAGTKSGCDDAFDEEDEESDCYQYEV